MNYLCDLWKISFINNNKNYCGICSSFEEMSEPKLKLINPEAKPERQQCALYRTQAARSLERKGDQKFPLPSPGLLDEKTALNEARHSLNKNGYSNPSKKQCLGQLVIPFGKYRNATFKWLIENDVGYVK